MQDLSITLIQTTLHWHNAEQNRQMFQEKIDAIAKPTDLIILPEMFSTGFSMKAEELAEKPEGKSVQWMQEMAAKTNAVITGSLIIEQQEKFYNRLYWVRPDGSLETYDKRHLFRMAQEEKTYTAGTKHLLVELKGWRILPLICYDLRFPVWCRNTMQYDFAFFVANWPGRRSLAWQTLLQARATENLAYVAGVNRVGEDGNGISYSGDSAVHAPDGETLYSLPHQEEVKTVLLEAKKLLEFREKFPAHLDADKFTLL